MIAKCEILEIDWSFKDIKHKIFKNETLKHELKNFQIWRKTANHQNVLFSLWDMTMQYSQCLYVCWFNHQFLQPFKIF